MAIETFTFGGVDVKNNLPEGTELIVREVRRPLKKPKTRHKVAIPGRAGSWDFGGEVAQDFPVEVDITIFSDTYDKVMSAARQVASNLDGKELLIFDDDPTESYTAQVYEMIGMEAQQVANHVQATIIFDCDA